MATMTRPFADGIRFRVEIDRFDEIGRGMKSAVDRVCAKTAFDLQGNAQVRAPVDTGALKNSIQTTKIGQAHYRVTVGAEYGAYVEFGTYRMAAQPYFTPAFEKVVGYFQQAMRKVFDRGAV